MNKDKPQKMSWRFLLWFLVGISSVQLIDAQSITLDRELGRKGAQEVIDQIGIYQNEVAQTYVQAIGSRLIEQINQPLFEYSFELVDMPEPNAFALPGGYIFVSRGLLCVANTEDELAGVIGHEIVHSENRHSVKQMKRSIFPALLQLPGAIVGTVVSEDLGNLINIPVSAGSELLHSKYSRNHEKEADQLGIRIVAAAGYDPAHLATILTNLSREVETISGEKEKFSYFDSHPFTPNRVSYIEKEVSNLTIRSKDPLAVSQEDFLKKIDGTYYWDNPAGGIFKGDTFMHPDLGLLLVFPKNWSTFNTPAYVGATDMENHRGMTYLGMADTNAAPEILGNAFVSRLKEKHQSTPDRFEKLSLNGLDAYIVTLIDNTGTEPVGIHNLWFSLNGNTFQAIGISYESDFELLKNSANTIRPMLEQEVKSIEVPVLRFIKAHEGETLEALSKRSGNHWSPELTAIMNNIPPHKSLGKEQLVKIARMEKYME
jgi:predicted Zn-dependent protease